MSLEIDGVWEAGVWSTTVWADGVWHEGEPIVASDRAIKAKLIISPAINGRVMVDGAIAGRIFIGANAE